MRGITALFTDLTSDAGTLEATETGVSSLMDTWILLRNVKARGEQNRALHILKSRGMPHSNQVRGFRITDRGIDLSPAAWID